MLNSKQESYNTNFSVFGLTRPGIEPESTVSVADALSTQPLNARHWRAAARRSLSRQNLLITYPKI